MMSAFNLKIMTPDSVFYDGDAENLIVRTTVGEVGILANHAPYVAALGLGRMRVMKDGKFRDAALAGGILKTGGNKCEIMAESCEWKDEIDVKRAENAKAVAEEQLKLTLSAHEQDIAEYKLHRALNRINVGSL
jgi:F-type H+-transporting ATPase subunit epsilon